MMTDNSSLDITWKQNISIVMERESILKIPLQSSPPPLASPDAGVLKPKLSFYDT